MNTSYYFELCIFHGRRKNNVNVCNTCGKHYIRQNCTFVSKYFAVQKKTKIFQLVKFFIGNQQIKIQNQILKNNDIVVDDVGYVLVAHHGDVIPVDDVDINGFLAILETKKKG